MDNERVLIPVRVNDGGGLNVEYMDDVIVSWEGQEIECQSMGWILRQDGTYQVKLSVYLNDAMTNRVPMDKVKIVPSPRERYLLSELGRMSSLADEYRSERDDARAVVEAARELMATPLPERIIKDITWGTMEREKIAVVSTYEFQRRLVLLAEVVKAYEQVGE